MANTYTESDIILQDSFYEEKKMYKISMDDLLKAFNNPEKIEILGNSEQATCTLSDNRKLTIQFTFLPWWGYEEDPKKPVILDRVWVKDQ
jgi:hypothetical protein